ncbi:hypothetical protein [Ralstonia pseudosolanacearum]
MDKLNAPRIANNADDLNDMLRHLSEWCAAQVNSPVLGAIAMQRSGTCS